MSQTIICQINKMPLNRFPFLTKEVKVRSKVNKFPSNTDLIPSLINISYQIELAKPHLENKCFFDSSTSLYQTQHRCYLSSNTPLPPKFYFISYHDNNISQEKKLQLQAVPNSPTMMWKVPPFPPQLKEWKTNY